MIHEIFNDDIKISIFSKGAELCSIQKQQPIKIEYMWSGDKDVWERRSPNLFPITGRLKEERYEIDGKSYSMPIHGFAKESEFEVMEKTKSKIIFLLNSNKKTKEIYPFDFQFFITYELKKHTILITYKVINVSISTMFFSIGAHPGFKCPLFNEELLEDYFIEFEHEEIAQAYRHTETELLSKKPSKLPLINGKYLPLTKDLFNEGVYVLKSPRSNWVALKNKNNNHSVKISFKDFPYFCLWSKPNTPFICFEPWYGVTDIEGSSFDITKREGIIRLEKNDHFNCQYNITIE
ncbi:MAG: aldose 1-epimerase family protein [Vallitalea sp.]|nr:aldose 1-epimerase family protein [Vallitalea sp.]